VQDVNRLLRQFAQMRKMLKVAGAASRRMRQGKRRDMARPAMR
jgi:signal recognition particle GTPase